MNYVWIFLGGGLGSLFRFGLWKWLGIYSGGFPWATLSANALSSFILGLLLGFQLKGSLNDSSQVFLMIGFCGAFSTFSTFSAETLKLLQYGHYYAAVSYVLGSVLLCLLLIIGGMKLV